MPERASSNGFTGLIVLNSLVDKILESFCQLHPFIHVYHYTYPIVSGLEKYHSLKRSIMFKTDTMAAIV